MKARDVIKRLEKDDWYLKRINGSHHIFRHPTKPGIVVVAQHGAKDIPEGTLKVILKQAGLD